MSAQVILTATKGALEGQQFTFTGKMQCVVGRSSSCDVHVPADDYTVSRRHCLLDIDSPTVTVQDLGSLNGTYLNKELIGRRDKRLPAEEAIPIAQPEFALEDGDEFQVGNIIFRVHIIEEPEEAEPLEKAGTDAVICC